MKKPDYCTQNEGDCPTCSLVNYGRDCQNNKVDYAAFAAATLGRVKSDKKAASSRENGKKGGRPRGHSIGKRQAHEDLDEEETEELNNLMKKSEEENDYVYEAYGAKWPLIFYFNYFIFLLTYFYYK